MLECSPPGAEHAGRYGQQAGGTHPTGMHSCLVSRFEAKKNYSIEQKWKQKQKDQRKSDKRQRNDSLLIPILFSVNGP